MNGSNARVTVTIEVAVDPVAEPRTFVNEMSPRRPRMCPVLDAHRRGAATHNDTGDR